MWRAMAATVGLTLTLSVPLPAHGEEGDVIPDLVFARMVENPVSGITRVPVANATAPAP